jgi:hypothetical protein
MAKMSKIAKKFFGISIFYWVLIIIVFLFVTGIIRVGFVFVENFASNSESLFVTCKKRKYNESDCNSDINKQNGCSWKIDEYTGSGKCMCCKNQQQPLPTLSPSP